MKCPERNLFFAMFSSAKASNFSGIRPLSSSRYRFLEALPPCAQKNVSRHGEVAKREECVHDTGIFGETFVANLGKPEDTCGGMEDMFDSRTKWRSQAFSVASSYLDSRQEMSHRRNTAAWGFILPSRGQSIDIGDGGFQRFLKFCKHTYSLRL